ncbi:thioredoxin family protein [Chitinophaga sp. MM2321]|uniref:thioredoxin family protein n=1 Tax=Chitinophaga sp. MM2321 TaxID=3137178 RepID=UPI0032D593A3
MKKINLTIILLSLHFTLNAQSSGISFSRGLSWNQILEKAKIEKKFIFLDIYATWCGPCKEMDREVYSQPILGDYFNDKFISIKVQQDTTNADDESTKTFRKDAENLTKKYNVSVLPTFLFFSTDGELLQRDFGFKKTSEFLELGKQVLDPKKQYLTLLADYKNGKRDLESMFLLLNMAKQNKNKTLVDSIVFSCGEYLDKKNEFELTKKNNLVFYGSNSSSISSEDRIFGLAAKIPKKLDSIIGQKGWANDIREIVINREEIQPNLWDGLKEKNTKPNWKLMESTISKKYSGIDADLMVLKAKINYYRKIENWSKYIKFRNRLNSIDPPRSEPMEIFLRYNAPAWDIFLYSTDRSALKAALKWSEHSLNQELNIEIKMQFYDTKSNLLYKLGREREAIQLEKKVIEISNELGKRSTKNGKGPLIDDYLLNLKKMKLNQPTWPVQKNR